MDESNRQWLKSSAYRKLLIASLGTILALAAPAGLRAQDALRQKEQITSPAPLALQGDLDSGAAATQDAESSHSSAEGPTDSGALDGSTAAAQATQVDQPDHTPSNVAPADADSTAQSQTSSPPPQQNATQTTAPPEDLNPLRGVPKAFFRDEGRLWTAPFQAHHYNSHTMVRYILPFTLITGALIASDKYTSPHLPNSPGVVMWSNRIGTIGAPYTPFAIGLATYLVGRKTHNRHAVETGLLSMEALAHAELIGLVIKEATQRERPNVLPLNNLGFWRGGTSFPSGHAIGAFAVANVFSREYHDHIAVSIVAYSLASIVAFSRASGRDHWTSDLFAGAFAGILVGRWVYREHHDPTLPGSPGKLNSPLRPDIAIGNGVQLSWHF